MEHDFFDSLHKQAKEGKSYAAKLICEISCCKPVEGIRARFADFLQEKARLVLLAVAMLKHAVKGNAAYGRILVRMFPDIDQSSVGIHDYLRISCPYSGPSATLQGAAA